MQDSTPLYLEKQKREISRVKQKSNFLTTVLLKSITAIFMRMRFMVFRATTGADLFIFAAPIFKIT